MQPFSIEDLCDVNRVSTRIAEIDRRTKRRLKEQEIDDRERERCEVALLEHFRRPGTEGTAISVDAWDEGRSEQMAISHEEGEISVRTVTPAWGIDSLERKHIERKLTDWEYARERVRVLMHEDLDAEQRLADKIHAGEALDDDDRAALIRQNVPKCRCNVDLFANAATDPEYSRALSDGLIESSVASIDQEVG